MKTKKYKKQRIPPTLRLQVFELYSNERTRMLCYCCAINIITVANFECGHVIPECKGGLLEIDNLRPICSPCNKSMGSNYLYDYKNKFYKSTSCKKYKQTDTISCKKIKYKNTLKDIIKCILMINTNKPMHYIDITKNCFRNQHIYECKLNGKTPINTISRTLSTNKDCFIKTKPGTYKLTNEYILSDDFNKKYDMCLIFTNRLQK